MATSVSGTKKHENQCKSKSETNQFLGTKTKRFRFLMAKSGYLRCPTIIYIFFASLCISHVEALPMFEEVLKEFQLHEPHHPVTIAKVHSHPAASGRSLVDFFFGFMNFWLVLVILSRTISRPVWVYVFVLFSRGIGKSKFLQLHKSIRKIHSPKTTQKAINS